MNKIVSEPAIHNLRILNDSAFLSPPSHIANISWKIPHTQANTVCKHFVANWQLVISTISAYLMKHDDFDILFVFVNFLLIQHCTLCLCGAICLSKNSAKKNLLLNHFFAERTKLRHIERREKINPISA